MSVSTCGGPVLLVWLVTLTRHKVFLEKQKSKQAKGHNYLIVLYFSFEDLEKHRKRPRSHINIMCVCLSVSSV